MTYTIVNTAGQTVATVNEAVVNSNFDVTLIGKNYTNYGQIFNDNMYRLLENFAAPNPNILKPVKGQIWFNTTSNTLNLYDGSSWNSFAGAALTIKGTKVGINNKNPEFDMDITSTLRSKGAAWINYAGANNSDANQSGLVLGTVGKGVLPTNNAGTIGIWSSEAATSRLQAMLSLKTDPTVANRRLAIGVIEQGIGWRNVTLAETGGNVGIGTTAPDTKLDVRGVSRVSNGTINSDQGIDGSVAYAGTSSNHAYVIKTNAANRVFVTATGSVGIGTDAPADVLEVVGNIVSSGSNASINFKNSTGVAHVYYDDALTFKKNGVASSSLTIDSSGNIGINQPAPANKLDILTADNTTEGLRLLSDGDQWVQMHASLDAGDYNPSVLAGDSAIIYSAGTIDTGRLVIAPWGTTKSGIVIDSTGKFGTNTLSVAQFTGTDRGAFTINDINSTTDQWTALEFSNPVQNEIPLARIAMKYTTGGSYLSLGTSQSYASGITNQALTIDPVGRVGIGTGTPQVQLHVVNDTNTGTSSDNAGLIVSSTNRNGYFQADGLNSSSYLFSNSGIEKGRIIYDNTNNFMAFTVNGIYPAGEKMRILPTGLVGIGTATPLRKLSINGGSIAFQEPAGSARTIHWGDELTDTWPIMLYGDSRSGTEKFQIFVNTFGNMGIAAVARITVLADGNVGVGLTPDGSALLDVASTVQAVTPGPIASSSHGAFRIKADATDSQGVLQFVNHAGNVQKGYIRVTSLGEMVLHAAAPAIAGISDIDNFIISPTGVYTDGATGNSKGQGTINAKGLFVNGVAVVAGTGAGYTPTYPVTPNQNWTWTDPGGQPGYVWGSNDGNIMRPYLTTRLSVSYAANAANAVSAGAADRATFSNTAGVADSLSISRNYNVNSLGVGCGASGTTGQIYATNNIVAFYSDQRLKKNIELIINPLDKVLSLRGVTYTQNELAEQYGYSDYSSQVGVIAQDVQAVLPEAVKLAPFDTDTDGTSKSGENYMTVQYEKIVPLLIEAIKELSAKVAELEEKLK